MYFPRWWEFEAVRNFTNLLDNFKRTVTFILEFFRGQGSLNALAIKKDEGAWLERRKSAEMLVE